MLYQLYLREIDTEQKYRMAFMKNPPMIFCTQAGRVEEGPNFSPQTNYIAQKKQFNRLCAQLDKELPTMEYSA